MTVYNKLIFEHPIGMGQPTHVLVDTLQHPAVELTQAEGAAVDSSDVSDASSASSSSSNSLDLVSDYLTDDWMIIITGVIGGCVGCILLLAIVSVTTRRCYNNRHSSRRHKHNQQHRDSSGLNNSESSSEKGCYGDPTITSDNMILMSNGEMNPDDCIATSANYDQAQTISHATRKNSQQCVQQQPNQVNFDTHGQDVTQFQHVIVGANSTMRKGILKHHQTGSTITGKNVTSGTQPSKPDVIIGGNKDGQCAIQTIPSLPPKMPHNVGVSSIASSVHIQGCRDNANEFGKLWMCIQEMQLLPFSFLVCDNTTIIIHIWINLAHSN